MDSEKYRAHKSNMKHSNAMEKILLTAVSAAAVAAVSHGQGTIYIDNTINTGVYQGSGGTVANPVYSSAVTQNGLIFTLDPAEQEQNFLGGRAGSILMGDDFCWALYAGATAAATEVALFTGTPLASNTGAGITGDNATYGGVQDQTGDFYRVLGSMAGSTVYLDLQVWEGNRFPSYESAMEAGDGTADTGLFANPSGGSGFPSGPGAFLTGMPDVLIWPPDPGLVIWVPEPGILSLAALDGASLLLFRRKK
jgi:hypothetical protein